MTQHSKRTGRGVVVADAPDHERRYVATKKIRWGDEWLEPGQEVPQEEGRNYGALVRHGEIAPYVPLSEGTGR